MFSQYLTYLLEKLHFFKVVTARFLIILFRRKKRIEELYLNYSKEHIFDNSYIIINYRFKNAIYYRFGKYITLNKQIKIFNLKNFDQEFNVIVYGLFNRKIVPLKFEPKLTLNTDTFKTNISNLDLILVEKPIPKLSPKEIYCDIKKPLIETPEIIVKNKKITISNTIFNQNEFI